MHIKTGDNVKVLSGRDRGKTGKIIQVLSVKGKALAVVEGVNMRKKHLRARGNEKGRTIELSMPIDASNVMLLDPQSGKPTRVGVKKEGDKKTRVAKKSGSVIA